MASPASFSEMTAAPAEPSTGGFVGRFGLDPWLLLAQVVNVLILLVVLSKFVYRPLLTLLRERSANIDRGLRDAAAARAERDAAEAEKRLKLRLAAAEAAKRLRVAEEEASRLQDRMMRATGEEVAAMHDRAEREAQALKVQALRAAAGETGDLMVRALERVLGKSLSPKERDQYRDSALRALRTES